MSATLTRQADFRLESEGGGWLLGEVRSPATGAPKPVLIIGHGFRGHKDWGFWPDIAARFAQRGYYTVTFNFARIAEAASGDERREAEASTLSRELADWRTVADAASRGELPLADAEADRGKIAVLGHSRAGSTSLLLAAERQGLKAVVVWNGGGEPNGPAAGDGRPSSLKERAILEDLDRNRGRYDVKRAFAGLTTPALVVQGDRDNERLLAQNRALRELAPSHAFVAIPGGDHTFGAVDPYEGTTASLDLAFEETAGFLDRAFGRA